MKNSLLSSFSVFKLIRGVYFMRHVYAFLALFGVLSAFPFCSADAATLQDPNDPEYPNQSYLMQIHAPEAWGITRGNRRVVVALIDSGVEFSHPDLQENIWTNPAEILDGIDNDGNGLADDIHGWDFLGNKPNPGPDFGAARNDLGFHHGTIVAGIIGAAGNNSTAGVGVNWKVSIMPLRALNGIGDSGAGEPIGVINAINYAIAHKVDVINMSFVGKKLGQELVNAIRRAYEEGITVVAAAGNEGNGTLIDGDLDFSPRYPICLDGPQGEPWWVIGVAALDDARRKALFSGYGKRCIDISAPGVKIPSTLVVHQLEPGFDQMFGGLFSGTSLAAPQVTGAVALLKSIKPSITPKEIYDVLVSTADPVDNENPLYAGELGAGLLNVGAAVKKVRDMVVPSAIWFSSTQSPLVAQLDADGTIQKKMTFNYGKAIGVSFGRARSPESGEYLTVAASANQGSRIRIFDNYGVPQGPGFSAFPANYSGGIQIAVGDVDGDGEDDIISAPARRYKPEVHIYSLSGALKGKFLAYAPLARLGLTIALADVDGDGVLDIITGVREGGSAHIRAFNGVGTPIIPGFFASSRTYRGGINFAAADLDGDGRTEIITVPLRAQSPTVRVYSTDGELMRAAPLANSTNSQFAVAVGDIARDGNMQIIVARTGRKAGFQYFSSDLEEAGGEDKAALPREIQSFKGAPAIVIAP